MNETQRAIKLLAEANGMTVVEAETKDTSWGSYQERDPFQHSNYALPYSVHDADNLVACYATTEELARKIAALPDLLEAAEAVDYYTVQSCIGSKEYPSGLPDLESLKWDSIHKTRKAIAKAKGVDNE